MPDKSGWRISLVLVLLAAIVGSLVWFGAIPADPAMGVFADNEDIVPNYDTYLDSRVVVSGPVVATDPLTIRASTETGETMDIRVTDTNPQLSEGDVLSVYGTLQPDQQVAAINTVVKPAGDYWRTRVLSAIAGLWVLWRGLRHWRPKVRAFLIERREGTDA